MFELIDVLGILLLFILTLFFIVLFHELGHALMILAFAKGDVNIYIGSYGEVNNTVQIRTGRLTTHIKYNPVKWRIGICFPPKTQISTNHQIIYIAAGPIVSLVSGLFALYIFQYINPGIVRFELMFFGIFSVFVGIVNFFPVTLSKKAINGQRITSDGYKLLQLIRMKLWPPEFAGAVELFNKEHFVESSNVLQTLIEKGNKSKHVLRLAINANLRSKNYHRSDQLVAVFLKKHLPNSDDYYNAGYIKSAIKDEKKAIELYKKSLALNSRNITALNNIGHSLIELGHYPEAIMYLEAAISESPKFCYAYSNLALAKMKLGELDAGLEATQFCLELDPNFAHAHTCLGVYNLKKGKLTEAKRCFEKSKELDSDDLSNDDYLRKVEEMMGKNIL